MRCGYGGGRDGTLLGPAVSQVCLSARAAAGVLGTHCVARGRFLETSVLKVSGADWKLPVEKAFPTWDVLQTQLPLLRARGAQRDLHSPGTSSPGGTVRAVTPLSEAPPPTPLRWRALRTPALGRLGSPEGPETGPPGWVLGQACRGQCVWGPHSERSSSYSTIPPPDLPILPPCVVSRPLKLGVHLGLGRRWKAGC